MKKVLGFVAFALCAVISVDSFANSQEAKLAGLQVSYQEDGAVTITQPTVVYDRETRRIVAKGDLMKYVCRYYGFEEFIAFSAGESDPQVGSVNVVALNTRGTMDVITDSFDSFAPVIENITCQ